MPRGRQKRSDEVLMRSAEFIGWALGGLEREIAQTRERLAALTAQAAKLRARAGRPSQATAAASPTFDEPKARQPRKLYKMSSEARKRASERMKKRWAEYRKNKNQA